MTGNIIWFRYVKYSAESGSPAVTIGGGFLFVLGAALLGIFFYLLDQPEVSRRERVAALVALALAISLIWIGMSFLFEATSPSDGRPDSRDNAEARQAHKVSSSDAHPIPPLAAVDSVNLIRPLTWTPLEPAPVVEVRCNGNVSDCRCADERAESGIQACGPTTSSPFCLPLRPFPRAWP